VENIRMDFPLATAQLPLPQVAEGYELVTVNAERVELWAQALTRAFPDHPFTAAKLQEEFINKPQFDPKGVFLILQAGKPVATAFAWLDAPEERAAGRLHWVGCDESQRGKGLGRAVVVAVLNYLKVKGLSRATLDTQTYRLPAIQLYLDLGFVPFIGASFEQLEAWSGVFKAFANARKR
jgi:mycothiol synthase